MFENFYERITALFSVIVGFLLGGWNIALTILILCMIMDYITGWAKAIKSNTLNSTIARWGIFQKFLMFIPIILSNLVDKLLGLNGTILSVCVIFYTCSEALSVCENLIELDVKLPKQLIDVLEKVKDKNSNTSIDNEIKEKK